MDAQHHSIEWEWWVGLLLLCFLAFLFGFHSILIVQFIRSRAVFFHLLLACFCPSLGGSTTLAYFVSTYNILLFILFLYSYTEFPQLTIVEWEFFVVVVCLFFRHFQWKKFVLKELWSKSQKELHFQPSTLSKHLCSRLRSVLWGPAEQVFFPHFHFLWCLLFHYIPNYSIHFFLFCLAGWEHVQRKEQWLQ